MAGPSPLQAYARSVFSVILWFPGSRGSFGASVPMASSTSISSMITYARILMMTTRTVRCRLIIMHPERVVLIYCNDPAFHGDDLHHT